MHLVMGVLNRHLPEVSRDTILEHSLAKCKVRKTLIKVVYVSFTEVGIFFNVFLRNVLLLFGFGTITDKRFSITNLRKSKISSILTIPIVIISIGNTPVSIRRHIIWLAKTILTGKLVYLA
jgi:hypothetical protein